MWTRMHFYKAGHFAHLDMYSVKDGTPAIVKAKVDLRPILKAVAKQHAQLHQVAVSGDCVGCDCVGADCVGDCVGCDEVAGLYNMVKKGVSKVAKAKLVKKVYRGAKKVYRGSKSVVKSPYTGMAAGALAVACPPVGVPALAAYAGARAAVAAAENGEKAAADAKKLAQYAKVLKASKSKKGGLKLQAKVNLNRKKKGKKPMSRAAIQKLLGRRMARVLAPYGKNRAVAMKRLQLLRRQGGKARKVIANNVRAYRNGSPAQREEAGKMLRILNIAARQRAAERAAKVALRRSSGILIDERGATRQGVFTQLPGGNGQTLYLNSGPRSGRFQ